MVHAVIPEPINITLNPFTLPLSEDFFSVKVATVGKIFKTMIVMNILTDFQWVKGLTQTRK